MLTIQTKRNLIRGGKFLHPGHYTFAEPHDLSRNRQSLPPPYTAVDPHALPHSSQTVRWFNRPINNPHKRRGNVALALVFHWVHRPIPTTSPLLADKLQAVVSIASSAGSRIGSRVSATQEQIPCSCPTHQIMIHTSHLDSQ
ncbi:hypothetical protein IW262DRAFT_1459327 [Armillaria fumosa]|nr:hypothetical protein IW262DRAFT_1459327 [Armillaria fumosa]